MSPDAIRSAYAPFAKAAATFTYEGVSFALETLMDSSAELKLCHPFGTICGPDALMSEVYAPLLAAVPDLERRDMIVIAGATPEGELWLGAMGNYMGTMRGPWLGIRPTGHLVHMRYHEFYRLEAGRIIEMHAIWDIPEIMMQAGVWPMAPQYGAYLATPAPMTQDGLRIEGDGSATMTHVIAMLEDLCRHPADPDPAVMQLDKYWHPRFNWYGPCGIGSARGIAGFRNWHQIPFLQAMPDRKLDSMGDLTSAWFAQGNYVCETGWPNMRLTLSDDGWMGIAPAGREVLLRSLDFWRMEDGLIRENWVLVDILDLYRQVGVDVFARLEHMNRARNMGAVDVPLALDPLR
ncbi:MAG: ester cyclase [Pseudomonadota bacterium]